MVTQDTSLLHRSVRENIVYGKPDATDEAMIAAAKRAEAHEFIQQLTDPKGRTGYDAHVGERGVKLSGGQRQHRHCAGETEGRADPVARQISARSIPKSGRDSNEKPVLLMEGKRPWWRLRTGCPPSRRWIA